MKLDYTSLSAPLESADVLAYKKSRTGSPHRSSLWVYVLIFLLFGIVILPPLSNAILSLLSGNTSSAYSAVILVFTLALIVVASVAYSRHEQRLRAKLYRFALQNHLEYAEDSTHTSYKGMIFDEGHSRVISQLLRFPNNAEIGNYEYVTGSGKNRSTHRYGYVKIPLTRNLPQMVLDGKANNLFGIITGLTDSFDRSQKLSLEGNFDKYFTLYAPKQYERDALYVFTPDVMQTLIDEGSQYDMEIVDNELYVYSNVKFNLNSENKLESILTIINTVGEEIRSQTKRYADERVENRNANIVAAGGKRLTGGLNLIVIVIVGIVIFNLGISVLDVRHNPLVLYITTSQVVIFWLAISAGALWKLIKFIQRR